MSRTTWQALADECRLMDAGEGWAFAERVACGVKQGSGGPRTVANATVSKATAREFAERWGCSADRVLRYLKRWDAEARKHGLPTSSELTPSDQGTISYDGVFPRWKHNEMELGSKTKDTEPGAQKVRDIKNNAASVAKALDADPAFAEKVASQRSATAKQRDAVQALENDPDVFGSKKVQRAAALAVTASFPPPPERQPSRYSRTYGDVAVSLGIQFVGALSQAIRHNKLSAQNATEIDEIVGNILDLLKKVNV